MGRQQHVCHIPCLIIIRNLLTAPQRTTMSHTEQPALQQNSASVQQRIGPDSGDAPRSLQCRDSTLRGNSSDPSKELSNTDSFLICSTCKSIDWQNIIEKLQQGRQRLRNFAEIFWLGDEEVRALHVPIILPPWSDATVQSTTPFKCPMCELFTEVKRECNHDEATYNQVLVADIKLPMIFTQGILTLLHDMHQ
jgi:hypothetical protein